MTINNHGRHSVTFMSMIIILNHQRLQLGVLKTHHYENYQRKGVLDRPRKVKIFTKKNSKCKPQSILKKWQMPGQKKLEQRTITFAICLPKSSGAWLRDHRRNSLNWKFTNLLLKQSMAPQCWAITFLVSFPMLIKQIDFPHQHIKTIRSAL